MAKYVCDFAQVYSSGEKICQVANDMNSAANNYSSQVENHLSSWNGVAKNSFSSANTEQVRQLGETAKYISALGEFVQTAAQKIEELEEELASFANYM